MDFSGREIIAPGFFFCVSFEFTQCSPIKYQLRCTPSSVYNSHQKHKILKLFNTVINVFGSWPFLLNTTQGSSLDLTPDPVTDANISIHTTHMSDTRHIATGRQDDTRATMKKKVVNYSIRRCGVYDAFFFLACFILFFVFPLIYGTF